MNEKKAVFLDVETRGTDSGSSLFVASTPARDRMGDVIELAGWKLDRFQQNPVILADHRNEVEAIVGRGKVWTDPTRGLMLEVVWADTERAKTARQLYEGGFARAVSVGFLPVKYDLIRDEKGLVVGIHFLEQELLEVSLVTVPANPDALMVCSLESRRTELNPRDPQGGPLSAAPAAKGNDMDPQVMKTEDRFATIEKWLEDVEIKADRALQAAPADPDRPTGTERVLRSGQSLTSWLRAKGTEGPADVSPGQILRALVTGPRNEAERKALAEGTDSAGGYTMPTALAAQVIDRLRANSMVFRAGASLIPLSSGKNAFAKLLTDPAASWHAENANITDSDPTFGNIQLTPRTLLALVKVSRELLEDSVNVESALINALTQSLSLELDRAALFGSGTAPELKGLTKYTNVGQVSMGTNGAQLTNWDKVIDAVNEILIDNGAEPNAMVMAPRTWAAIAKFKDTTGAPLAPPPALAKVQRLVSTAVPIAETQGTASNASEIILGDWRELMIGMRAEVRVEILKERFSADAFQVGFLAYLRADVAPAHEESFARLIGIIP